MEPIPIPSHVFFAGILASLAILASGCTPSGFLARQMVFAPNRVPSFLKPDGRVLLRWESGLIERFPSGSNRVGCPPALIHWRLVDAANYGAEVTSTNRAGRRSGWEEFELKLRLPTDGSLPPAGPPLGTAFVLHGYGGDLETMLPVALDLAQAGWRSILVDLRGHGLSEGRRVGFGLLETDDLRELREALASSGAVVGPCVAVGHSLGAAVALRWQAVDPAIVASVAYGAFADFTSAAERLRRDRARWVPAGWVRRAAGKVPGLFHGEPDALDPLSAIRNHSVRALLVASDRDEITPPEDSERLREHLGPGSGFLIVGKASHEALPYVLDQHGGWVRKWIAGAAAEAGGTPNGQAPVARSE